MKRIMLITLFLLPVANFAGEGSTEETLAEAQRQEQQAQDALQAAKDAQDKADQLNKEKQDKLEQLEAAEPKDATPEELAAYNAEKAAATSAAQDAQNALDKAAVAVTNQQTVVSQATEKVTQVQAAAEEAQKVESQQTLPGTGDIASTANDPVTADYMTTEINDIRKWQGPIQEAFASYSPGTEKAIDFQGRLDRNLARQHQLANANAFFEFAQKNNVSITQGQMDTIIQNMPTVTIPGDKDSVKILSLEDFKTVMDALHNLDSNVSLVQDSELLQSVRDFANQNMQMMVDGANILQLSFEINSTYEKDLQDSIFKNLMNHDQSYFDPNVIASFEKLISSYASQLADLQVQAQRALTNKDLVAMMDIQNDMESLYEDVLNSLSSVPNSDLSKIYGDFMEAVRNAMNQLLDQFSAFAKTNTGVIAGKKGLLGNFVDSVRNVWRNWTYTSRGLSADKALNITDLANIGKQQVVSDAVELFEKSNDLDVLKQLSDTMRAFEGVAGQRGRISGSHAIQIKIAFNVNSLSTLTMDNMKQIYNNNVKRLNGLNDFDRLQDFFIKLLQYSELKDPSSWRKPLIKKFQDDIVKKTSYSLVAWEPSYKPSDDEFQNIVNDYNLWLEKLKENFFDEKTTDDNQKIYRLKDITDISSNLSLLNLLFRYKDALGVFVGDRDIDMLYSQETRKLLYKIYNLQQVSYTEAVNLPPINNGYPDTPVDSSGVQDILDQLTKKGITQDSVAQKIKSVTPATSATA